jgi:hypothetical protein
MMMATNHPMMRIPKAPRIPGKEDPRVSCNVSVNLVMSIRPPFNEDSPRQKNKVSSLQNSSPGWCFKKKKLDGQYIKRKRRVTRQEP